MTPQEEFEQEWKKLRKPWQDSRGDWHDAMFNLDDIRLDNMNNYYCCDRNLGQHFSAHGIAKGFLNDQKESLFALLENGISKKTYYAPFVFTEEDAPLMGPATGTAGGAYKDGLAVVISGYKQDLLKDGIKLVLLTDLGESLLPSLRKMYPNIMFEKLSQAQKAFETLYTEATGKQWKTKINAPSTQNLTQSPQPNIPTAPMPRISTSQKQQTPVDKLILQHFKDGKGHSGIRYLDQQGNVVITETYAPNCKTRVYSNGLTMRMWDNPKSTTYTDGSKTGKDATEIMITEAGRGCTKDVSTTGELKRKIEEVRKAGLLVTNLPQNTQKSSTLRGRLARHSVDNTSKITGRIAGNQGA